MIACCIFKLCDILWNGWSNCCKRVLKKINSVYKLPSLNLGFFVVKGIITKDLNKKPITFDLFSLSSTETFLLDFLTPYVVMDSMQCCDSTTGQNVTFPVHRIYEWDVMVTFPIQDR